MSSVAWSRLAVAGRSRLSRCWPAQSLAAGAGAPTPGRADRHAGQGARQRNHHPRPPRIVDPVLLPVGARRADRLFDRSVQAGRRGDRRGSVGREIAIRWLPVTPESRIPAVTSGQVDLECGSTTNNLERQKLVGFSPTIFVSGTKLLVKKGSPIRSFRDLAGKNVAVTAGTTNEKTMRELAAKFKIDMTLRVAPDHAASFALLTSGAGRCVRDRRRAALRPAGAEQRAGRVHRDRRIPLLRSVRASCSARVTRSSPRSSTTPSTLLAEDGEIERRYKRWFLQKLPRARAWTCR